MRCYRCLSGLHGLYLYEDKYYCRTCIIILKGQKMEKEFESLKTASNTCTWCGKYHAEFTTHNHPGMYFCGNVCENRYHYNRCNKMNPSEIPTITISFSVNQDSRENLEFIQGDEKILLTPNQIDMLRQIYHNGNGRDHVTCIKLIKVFIKTDKGEMPSLLFAKKVIEDLMTHKS